MKRLPLVISFFSFILLCMSLSFWGLRIFKPQARNVAAPALQASFEPGGGQWGTLFGNNQIAQMAASNYQLKGVVVARRTQDSAAIVSANGKPTQSVGVGQELAAGVTLKEVHDQYILISEGGAIRRIDLPQPSPASRISLQTENSQFAGGSQSVRSSPVAFPAHSRNPTAPLPIAPGVPPSGPMVTPGLPTASLPAVMPDGAH